MFPNRFGSPFLNNSIDTSEDENFNELLGMLTELQGRVIELESNNHIDESSPVEQIDDFRDLMREYIADSIWRKVFYHSSLTGPAVETVDASEKFDGGTRQSDTSGGKFLSQDREGRFRAHFYYNSTDATDCTSYIASFVSVDTDTGITSINQDGVEYVALKNVDSVLTIVGKNSDGIEEKDVAETITDDSTHVVEIDYFPGERADFYLDGIFIGTINDRLPKQSDPVTIMPLAVSLTRSGGTNRKLTIENWEFLQSRV